MNFTISWVVSVTNAEGPPVPIPNTEVKLCSGEDTLREAVRENSSMLTQSRSGVIHSDDWKKGRDSKQTQYGGVAQLGEHLPCKQGVMGSNPIISTIGTTVPHGTYVPISEMMPIENTRTQCEGFEVTKLPASSCEANALNPHHLHQRKKFLKPSEKITLN